MIKKYLLKAVLLGKIENCFHYGPYNKVTVNYSNNISFKPTKNIIKFHKPNYTSKLLFTIANSNNLL